MRIGDFTAAALDGEILPPRLSMVIGAERSALSSNVSFSAVDGDIVNANFFQQNVGGEINVGRLAEGHAVLYRSGLFSCVCSHAKEQKGRRQGYRGKP
ncbi:MAG: hypothetical protein ACR5LF_03215 [Symbiopectobacterium sp.]